MILQEYVEKEFLMGSMKQTHHFVPCMECKGKRFLTRHSYYWTRLEDDTDLFCITMVVLICKTCNLTTYYAQEQDILDILEPPSQDIHN